VTARSFELTPQYIEEAIQPPAVKTWLTEPKQRFAPVICLLLLIGMKLIKRARIKYATSESTKVNGSMAINMVQLCMTFGPKGHWSSTNDNETEFNQKSEFVFEVRVRRLRFGRKLRLKSTIRARSWPLAKTNTITKLFWWRE
jgi:hypothetical protein